MKQCLHSIFMVKVNSIPCVTEVHALRYQPSCHNCFQFAIIVKIHGFQDLASKLEIGNHSTTNTPDIITIHLKFLSYGIIPHINMY